MVCNLVFQAQNYKFFLKQPNRLNKFKVKSMKNHFSQKKYVARYNILLTTTFLHEKKIYRLISKVMILNCAIIDEDPQALRQLKQYVDKTPTLHLIGAYSTAIEAVDGIRHNHLDILFLAIHMQQISGLEFAKVVPKNVKIIFTTAFKEYAIEAYKVNAFDYLLKPIGYEDFMLTCKRVFDSYMQDDNYNPIKRDKFLVVKRDYKYTRISIDDILFVDCEKDYLRFHLDGKPNVMTLGNLKHLEEKLPKDKFKRVHRSYLANMSKFDTIDQMRITYGDVSIPISETYFEEIKVYIDDHSL